MADPLGWVSKYGGQSPAPSSKDPLNWVLKYNNPDGYNQLLAQQEAERAAEEDRRRLKREQVQQALALGEQQWSQIQPPGPSSTMGAIGSALAETIPQVAALPQNAAELAASQMHSGLAGMTQAAGDVAGIDALSNFGQAWGDQAAAHQQQMAQDAAASPLLGPIQEAASVGFQLPVAALPSGLGMLAGQAAGSEYGQARSQGATPGQAGISAVTTGAAEFAGEKFLGAAPVLRRLASAASRSLDEPVKATLAMMGLEGSEELSSFIAQRIGQEATYSDKYSSLDPRAWNEQDWAQFQVDVRDGAKNFAMGAAPAGGFGLAANRAGRVQDAKTAARLDQINQEIDTDEDAVQAATDKITLPRLQEVEQARVDEEARLYHLTRGQEQMPQEVVQIGEDSVPPPPPPGSGPRTLQPHEVEAMLERKLPKVEIPTETAQVPPATQTIQQPRVETPQVGRPAPIQSSPPNLNSAEGNSSPGPEPATPGGVVGQDEVQTDTDTKTSGGLLGAVANAADQFTVARARGSRAPLPATGEAPTSLFPEVEQRIKAARGTQPEGVLTKAARAVKEVYHSFRRHDAELDPNASPEFARAADIFRLARTSRQAAEVEAFDQVDRITKDLSPQQGDLLTRTLILSDIARSHEKGLYEDKDLPFGYESIEAVKQDLNRYFEMMERPENIPVKSALDAREGLRKSIVGSLVEAGALPQEALSDPRYYHRMVLAYADAEKHKGGGFKTGKKGFQKKRTGGSDFNTDYQQAEWEWLADAYQVLAVKRLSTELRENSDITEELKAQAQREGVEKWRMLIPEGYVEWKPTKGLFLSPNMTVKEAEVAKAIGENSDLSGEDLAAIRGRDADSGSMVIPKEIAAVLDKESAAARTGLERAWVQAQSGWKQWTLLNPYRAIRYNLNNLSGDLDIALAESPKILKYMPSAALKLQRYHIERDPRLGQELGKLRELGVIDSGWSIQEVSDLKKEGALRVLYENRPGLLARGVQRYWRDVKDFTAARENLLRLAAFDYFKAEWAAGRKTYGASTASQVDAITDPDRRAAKLSRELIGDYGNVSEAGRWVRGRLMPFYSWMEINAPRYVRLLRNSVRDKQAGDVARVAGVAVAKAGVKAGTQAISFAAKATLLSALAAAWNRYKYPEEEKELGAARREPHIITGRDEKTGEIKSIRFQGALADALDWLGASDLMSDVQDVVTGRASVKDKLADAVKAPVEKGILAMEPFAKTTVEVATGRSVYPTVFRGGATTDFQTRPIQDRGEYISRVFSLGEAYKAATGKPRRGGVGSVLQAPLVYRTDPGEAAYYEVRELVGKFLDEKGIDRSFGGEKTDRQKALYYYKKAVAYGDEKAAERYLAKYKSLGGTNDGIRQSVMKGEPLDGVKKYKKEFMEWLSAEERDRLAQSEAWYAKRYKGKK